MTATKANDSGTAGLPPSKRAKVENVSAPEEGLLEGLAKVFADIEPMEMKIAGIDKECIKEQMKIQRDFERKKAPLLKERDAVFEKQEGFWAAAICAHPHLRGILTPPEIELMKSHLEKVELNDHIDDNGSYQVVFTFKPSASEIFTPLVLKKKVVFGDDENIISDKVEVTEITFNDSSKDPRKLVKVITPQQHDSKCECEDCELGESSVFEWFSSKSLSHPIMQEFGEIFRRSLYPAPEEAFLNSEDLSSEDGESAGDE